MPPRWEEVSEDEGGYRRCGVRWEHLVDKVGPVPVGPRSGAWARKELKEGVGWGGELGVGAERTRAKGEEER